MPIVTQQVESNSSPFPREFFLKADEVFATLTRDVPRDTRITPGGEDVVRLAGPHDQANSTRAPLTVVDRANADLTARLAATSVAQDFLTWHSANPSFSVNELRIAYNTSVDDTGPKCNLVWIAYGRKS